MSRTEKNGHSVWRLVLTTFIAVPIATAAFPEATSQKQETFLAWVVAVVAIQFLINLPLERIENRLKRMEKEQIDCGGAFHVRAGGGVVLFAEDFQNSDELRRKLQKIQEGRMVLFRSSPLKPELDKVWSEWIRSQLGG